MVTVISDTHTLITGKPGAQETVAPGDPAEVSAETADALERKGIVRRAQAEKPKQRSAQQGSPKPPSGVNVNEAAKAELAKAIDGVGKKTAGDIVASREADGPFQSLEDCAERVGGVSAEQLEAAAATV